MPESGMRRVLSASASTACRIALCLALVGPAAAQVAPSAAEIAAFGPLHAPAQAGDASRLAAALAGGAPINSRDPHGRTALHVATFARRRDIIKQLAAAGADLGA